MRCDALGKCVAPDRASDQPRQDILVGKYRIEERIGNKDICGYNLSSGKEFRITTDPADQESPAIFDGTVVWADHRNGNWDIYGANIAGTVQGVLIDGDTGQPITETRLLLTEYDRKNDTDTYRSVWDEEEQTYGGEASTKLIGGVFAFDAVLPGVYALDLCMPLPGRRSPCVGTRTGEPIVVEVEPGQ